MKTLSWMEKRTAVWLRLLLASPVAAEDKSPYQCPETRELVPLVEAAAAAIYGACTL